MSEAKNNLKNIIEEEIKKPLEKASIVDIVNNIIIYAYQLRASDIHFQPKESCLLVRFRIDGITHNIFEIAKPLQDEVISRLKIISNLRIDEHFAAQDGRFRFYYEDKKFFDVRISIMPTYYGENAILRLLVSPGALFSLDKLGLSSKDLTKIKRAIKKPYGMILATGPTGSGKTTMLYTILNVLNTEGVHIITIEDPIEYAIEGITQTQVNLQTNLTFSKGLRTILRQDPDIIMVGEIRDQETAEISVNAALTGHLLLSTLHTNDAPSAVIRLIELGIEPYLITSTVNIIIGQRLVRKICDKCKQERSLKDVEIQSLIDLLPTRSKAKFLKVSSVFYGKGCEVCNKTGYIGRTGIYETLVINETIKNLILQKVSSDILKQEAIKAGMSTMIEDGIFKVIDGITTIEEVLRVSHE
ncbi:MAG: general secretion pathway protein GspE [Candidatus Parcubacteria bacterium]|nr:MAG: general secretion pathway protein GspE [Candidatus Parcubacteria bacterium]